MILNKSYFKVKKKTISMFRDKRGYLIDVKKTLNFKPIHFLITNSKKNVLRGIHMQTTKLQDQAIFVAKGEIFDVIVDLRKNSKNFGKYKFFKLNDKSNKFLIIPKGFAHGYYALKDSIILYFNSKPYYPKYDKGFIYNDKIVNIKWPKGIKILSSKDKKLSNFEKFKHEIL
jgi:dTDP-4-dehydrorhamnose 3,5-epimerase